MAKVERKPPGHGRTRAEHLGPARRRPMVLDAALRLFVERGYDVVSIEAIAEAAGISRPVVYDCFPNKEALYADLLEREQQRLANHLLAAIPPNPTLYDPHALLRAGFTGFLTAAASAPDSWRLVFDSDMSRRPEVVGTVEAGRRMISSLIDQLASAALAAQQIGDPDGRLSRLVAYLIVGQAEAGVRLMLDDPDAWSAEELGELISRMTAPALGMLRRSD